MGQPPPETSGGRVQCDAANVNNNATAAHEQAQTAELSRNQAQAAATQAINAAATSGRTAACGVEYVRQLQRKRRRHATDHGVRPDNSPASPAASSGAEATQPQTIRPTGAALTASFAADLRCHLKPLPGLGRRRRAGRQRRLVSHHRGAHRVQDGASASTVAAMLARVSGG